MPLLPSTLDNYIFRIILLILSLISFQKYHRQILEERTAKVPVATDD